MTLSPEAPVPVSMLGAVVGNYKVVSQIGHGGMGAVYLARHPMLGRPAAVKVLLPEMSQNRDVVTRFFNEARAATAIRHPSIVEIYDFGFMPHGSAYIIMELLEGESLARRLERSGALPVELALLLVRQIAGALHAAHEQQIVHRDLKPDNVFVVRDPEIVGGERIKLLDFGIAKLASDAGDNKTQTGMVMGTPTYMSPEQCRGSGGIDHRTDLYALGCMLYELLCGRPPFVAEGAGDLIAHHLYFTPEPLRRYQPGLPEGLEPLVMWLLQKDPAARPASAAEVIAAIDRLTGHPPRAARAATNSQVTGPRSELRTVPQQAAAVAKPTTLGGAAGARSLTTMLVQARARWVGPTVVGGLLLAGGLGWLGLREERTAPGTRAGARGERADAAGSRTVAVPAVPRVVARPVVLVAPVAPVAPAVVFGPTAPALPPTAAPVVPPLAGEVSRGILRKKPAATARPRVKRAAAEKLVAKKQLPSAPVATAEQVAAPAVVTPAVAPALVVAPTPAVAPTAPKSTTPSPAPATPPPRPTANGGVNPFN